MQATGGNIAVQSNAAGGGVTVTGGTTSLITATGTVDFNPTTAGAISVRRRD